jgi:hypothetical protein
MLQLLQGQWLKRGRGTHADLVLLPVLILRWTHNHIEQHMYFRHDQPGDALPQNCRKSTYDTLNHLVHGKRQIAEPPPAEVVGHDRKLWSLSNRRLTILKLFQSMQQDKTMRV